MKNLIKTIHYTILILCQFSFLSVGHSELLKSYVNLQDLVSLTEELRGIYEKGFLESGIQLEFKLLGGPIGRNPISTEIDDWNEDENVIRRINIKKEIVDIPGMTKDGMALLICHEISHINGGSPFKVYGDFDAQDNLILGKEVNGAKKSSVEGQADYMASRNCFKTWAKLNSSLLQQYSSLSEMDLEKIDSICKSEDSFQLCKRGLVSIESFIQFFRYMQSLSGVKKVDYDKMTVFTKSAFVANTINKSPTFYPDFTCRIETLFNGILNLDRPKCWYVQ